MASKIRSITAVNLHGYHTYFVGETYHGLILDKIEDKTIEFPDLGCTCEYVKCERIRIGRCPVHPNNRKGRVDVLMAQVPVAKQMLGEGDTR